MSKAAELAALIGSQTALSNRNLIINGAMQVAQRGTQTNQTTAYTACDRFQFVVVGAAVITSSQDTTVPSGQGFSNSLKLDVTTADSSLAASDFAFLRHKIEAQNLQHLNYGTSSAKSLTLSFWVRSSKTGTHIAELRHDDATYFNSQAYTISSADVWQKVTLTYDGYVTTAINNDNGAGINVNWWLAAGSDYSGGTLSANTWQNTAANRAVGQVNVMDSTSNDFYITGVQLEVGETATPFEHRSFADEWDRCQRYCTVYNMGGGNAHPENLVKNNHTVPGAAGHVDVTNRAEWYMSYPVKRVEPTITVTDPSNMRWLGNGSLVKDGSGSVSFPVGTSRQVANVFQSCASTWATSVVPEGWVYKNSGTNPSITIDAEL